MHLRLTLSSLSAKQVTTLFLFSERRYGYVENHIYWTFSYNNKKTKEKKKTKLKKHVEDFWPSFQQMITILLFFHLKYFTSPFTSALILIFLSLQIHKSSIHCLFSAKGPYKTNVSSPQPSCGPGQLTMWFYKIVYHNITLLCDFIYYTIYFMCSPSQYLFNQCSLDNPKCWQTMT